MRVVLQKGHSSRGRDTFPFSRETRWREHSGVDFNHSDSELSIPGPIRTADRIISRALNDRARTHACCMEMSAGHGGDAMATQCKTPAPAAGRAIMPSGGSFTPIMETGDGTETSAAPHVRSPRKSWETIPAQGTRCSLSIPEKAWLDGLRSAGQASGLARL